jgi:hypothetical protein
VDLHDREAVDALTLDLLTELGPDEVPLYFVTRDAYWQQGGRLPRQRGGSGGLDFDAGAGIAVALAPIALAVSDFALRLLVDVLRQIATESSKHVAAGLYATLRRRFAGGEPETRPKLPDAEYRRLREQVAAEAARYLSATSAERLTDAILTRIAEREGASA